jgi:hypothetical protein
MPSHIKAMRSRTLPSFHNHLVFFRWHRSSAFCQPNLLFRFPWFIAPACLVLSSPVLYLSESLPVFGQQHKSRTESSIGDLGFQFVAIIDKRSLTGSIPKVKSISKAKPELFQASKRARQRLSASWGKPKSLFEPLGRLVVICRWQSST